MSQTVDSTSPVPVRMQLRSILLKAVAEGVYKPNQRIPSERDLSEQYQASRASVREAIAELISEGVLFRSGGRGTFVSEVAKLRAKVEYRQLGFWISEDI